VKNLSNINVKYTHFDQQIESVKIPIHKDIYQIITPVIKEVVDSNESIFHRYIEISIHDERLSNVITKCYTTKEILEIIRILQRVTKEVMSDEVVDNSNCK